MHSVSTRVAGELRVKGERRVNSDTRSPLWMTTPNDGFHRKSFTFLRLSARHRISDSKVQTLKFRPKSGSFYLDEMNLFECLTMLTCCKRKFKN